MNVEGLITDLAFILLLGAGVTILFKWIKQPVVLGYIVAGFLASPHFEYLPSVTTEANIDFWAQIGIVVLLFSLGLEFSFGKLMSAGGSAVVTALVIVAGMMGAGYAAGRLMGMNSINSLFLGGMLSMSSTTIIIKAFTDMGLRQQKFASLVLAVLIVEDLFAVVMMVILSSIAVNNSVEGTELLFSIGKLLFFLVIWFLVGVYVLPSLLNRWRRFLNSETLLVVSMGLCLGMAVFSVYCGFSLALGAFVMGSILAGTSYAERIEHVVTPVRDLFGAVFFISVGMMVQPAVLVQYWPSVLVLSAVVVTGMIVFGTSGMLVTGQTLRVAIQSGFSLTQIGEFAFIIATLGMSLGVLEPNLYPIVVAVSVITTFTTPYFIRLATPAYEAVERRLPPRLHFLIDRYRTDAVKEQATPGVWAMMLRRTLPAALCYAIVTIAIIVVCRGYVLPLLHGLLPEWAGTLTAVLTLAGMSPFLFALAVPVRIPPDIDAPAARVPAIVLNIFRCVLAVALAAYAVSISFSSRATVALVAVVAIVIVFVLSRRLRASLDRIETKFRDNLNERELRRSGIKNTVVGDLHQAFMTVGSGCAFVGDRLMDSDLRRRYGINVVSIQRDSRTIPIPNGRTRIFPGDVLGVIGNDEQLRSVLPAIEAERVHDAAPAADVRLTSILLGPTSPLIGSTPRSSSLRDRYEAVAVAVHRGDQYIDSDPDLVFAEGDVLWLVGDRRKIETLK